MNDIKWEFDSNGQTYVTYSTTDIDRAFYTQAYCINGKWGYMIVDRIGRVICDAPAVDESDAKTKAVEATRDILNLNNEEK